MFGFGAWSKRVITERMVSLAYALEHVGVHPAEVVATGKKEWSVSATAENVLLRQAEEIAALREQLSARRDPTQDVLARNLAYERQGRTADAIVYSDALRIAGREKAELTQKLARFEKAEEKAKELTDDMIHAAIRSVTPLGSAIFDASNAVAYLANHLMIEDRVVILMGWTGERLQRLGYEFAGGVCNWRRKND